MKKTIIALLALAGMAQADESSAYLTKDDSFSVDSKGKITLEEIAILCGLRAILQEIYRHNSSENYVHET